MTTREKVFMLMFNIEVERGGITSVMLNRSRALADKGYSVSLVTLDDNTRYHEISKKLREINRLSEKVDIVNVYDYYKQANTEKVTTDQQLKYYNSSSAIHESGFEVQADEFKTKYYARYFSNGVYVKYKKWNKDLTLSHVDYFNNQRKRTLREVFNKKGYIERKIFFDVNSNKQNQVVYYTEDGFCYLNKWFNSETEKLQQQFLFSRDREVLLFKNNIELHSHWLNEICSKELQKPFLLCDGIGSIDKVIAMDKNVAHRIYPFHTNHFMSPHSYGSEIKAEHKKLLNKLEGLDSVVVLSDEQKKDIVSQFGNYNNIDVIPNSINNVINSEPKRHSKIISIVARYDAIKQLDHSIRAFKDVIKSVPDAKLEIYGNGSDETRLKNIITELQLQSNVFIKGYSKDVSEVYSHSVVTILTSKYEGFGLVIAESMINETPVISYDISYGPKDIITNGLDGFLIEKDNIELLKEKMIFALLNQDKMIEMGVLAKENVLKKFSNDVVSEKWIELFEKLKQTELIKQ
ncbi:glycosyltransferase [Alkalicoccobacillus gibsonii]|uniref:glycosyltransferase n=1 Tax=Alkalicoccobacillus gibsonii TaxID=79881 RepID=UPI0035191FC7